MKRDFDVIVIGLGAFGSAAIWQLAQREQHVLGLDQYRPPHALGSSHGKTRIIRQAIGEGELYTPLAARSYELWDALEKASGRQLTLRTGGLILSSENKTSINHVPDFFQNTVAAAREHGIAHELLDAAQIRSRFPAFQIQEDEFGYYEPGAGIAFPEAVIEAQLAQARAHGAELHFDERLLEIGATPQGSVRIRTDAGVYEAGQLLLCAGPWLPQFLPEAWLPFFRVYRQVLYWFEIAQDPAAFAPGNFPVFVWELQGARQAIYGFPAVDGPSGGVKIATEQYETPTTPEAMRRDVSPEEIARMHRESVAPFFPGLSSHGLQAAACLYTVTPDAGFVIDRHPEVPGALICSACSGHGFKHSAAIGEALADVLTGRALQRDLSAFAMRRFL